MKFFAIGLWTIAAIATGYTLFYITFQVEALEAELTQLNREILEEQESIHILKAEWSYLNRPDRLEKLASHLLPELVGLSAAQISDWEKLPDSVADIKEVTSDIVNIAPEVQTTPVSLGVSQ